MSNTQLRIQSLKTIPYSEHVFGLQQSMDECTQEEIKEDYFLQTTRQGYLSGGERGALIKKLVEHANIKLTDTETQCLKQHLNRTRIY